MIKREYNEDGSFKQAEMECDCEGCDTEVIVLKQGEPIPEGWIRPTSAVSEKVIGKCFCGEDCYHKFLASGKKEGRPKESKAEKEKPELTPSKVIKESEKPKEKVEEEKQD